MRHAVLRSLLGVLVLLAAALTPAAAAERVALVVGNGAYEHTVALANPVNDAAAMAEALARLGFEVEVATDTTRAALESGIRDFAKAARGAELAIFFYAGHGLQVGGVNYLIPVDAVLESEDDLVFAAVDLNDVLGIMTRSAQASLVFLDACRDNPMATELSRSMGTRSTAVGRGLAPVDAAVGALIAYATQPGNVALDGQGAHSPFTAAMLEHMETPGLELRQVLTRVRDTVVSSTGGRQVPWDHSSLRGDVYLVLASPTPAPAEATGAEIWQVIQHSTNPKDFEFFLAKYPNSPFADFARLRLEALAPAGPSAEELAAEQAAMEAAADRTRELERTLAEIEARLATEAEARAKAEAEAKRLAEAAALADPAVPASAPEDVAAAQFALLQSDEAALGLDKAARQRVQRALTLLGYDTRGIDGTFGKNSRAAIAAFQKVIGASASGYLDKATFTRLMAEAGGELAAWEAAEKQRAESAAATSAAASTQKASQSAEADDVQQAAVAPPAASFAPEDGPASPWAGRWFGEARSTEVAVAVTVQDGAVDVVVRGRNIRRLGGHLDASGSIALSNQYLLPHGRSETIEISGTFPNFTASGGDAHTAWTQTIRVGSQ